MYFYKIGYWSLEESPYWVLTHKKKFNKEKFEKLIFEKVDKAIKIVKKEIGFVHSFEDVVYKVIKLLIEEEGFEHAKYQEVWNCFGWGSLFVNDWETRVDENLLELRKYLKEKGYTEEDDDLGRLKDLKIEKNNE